jgi:tetratricopeptide (TPR) repeat protein
LQPDHYLVWSGRAALFLRLGLWDLAAADFARALELGAPANHPGWWGVPQLCLYANRLDAYDTITRRMLQQYNDSRDDLLKIVILRGCLVHPEPVPQAEELLQMAEELLSQEHQGFPGYGFEGGPGSLFPFGPPPKPAGGPYPKPGPGPPHGPQLGPPLGNQFFGPPDAAAPRELPYYLVALAHLRNGHSDTALEYLEQAVESARYWPAQSMALPLQAMAYHRLGRSEEAATVLAEAAKTCEQWLDQMEDDALGALSVPWLDFIEYLILYREAHLAITASPLADDPRLAALRQRALAAIEPD